MVSGRQYAKGLMAISHPSMPTFGCFKKSDAYQSNCPKAGRGPMGTMFIFILRKKKAIQELQH
jgi:hypothetical protein